MGTLEPSRVDKQYEAWGVVIANTNGRGVHIANGLVQLLRLYPALCQYDALGDVADVERPKALTAKTRALLKAHFGEAWELSSAARGVCVAHSKNGPLSLQHAPPQASSPRERELIEATRALLNERLEGDLLEPARGLISSALNADARVYIKGGSDLSVSHLSVAGYTPTHTIRPMHAMTYLGALSNTTEGLEVLSSLYELFCDDRDPHSSMMGLLGLGEAFAPLPAPPQAPGLGIYPLPAQTERWQEFSELAAATSRRLLTWTQRGAKAETLSSLIELIGLLFSSHLWSWAGEEVLLVSELAPRRQDQPVIVAAQRSWQRAATMLNKRSREEGLYAEGYPPATALRTLARVTGWLQPRHSQGGAKHRLAPDARRLTTLMRALIDPGDEISWGEFRARARQLKVEIGGAPQFSDIARSPLTLKRAAEINKANLTALGLARQESDDVIRIDAGGAK